MLSIIDNMFNHELKSDCTKCFGLCCVALYFSSSEGFPEDKIPGKPCINLSTDFTCNMHNDLRSRGFKGCTAYDCSGAGQKVAQVTFNGVDWIKSPNSSKQMFEVFLVMRQLHEMLWYLAAAHAMQTDSDTQEEVNSLLKNTINLSLLEAESLIQLDVAAHRAKVSALLQNVSKQVRNYVYPKKENSKIQRMDYFGKDLRKTNLKGKDLRGACLIAANLKGVDLGFTDLIGADLRDADLSGADLSNSIFLTQAQINTVKGNSATKIPEILSRPAHWK